MKFDLLYHLISPVTGKLKILLNLGNGLLKTTNDGELSIAIPDEDFATSTTLEQIKSDTEFYRTEAQIASGTATNAASVATTAAGEASTAAINANTSMATATGAAISAAASAQSASNSANSAADSAAQAVQNIPTFNYPLLKTTNTLSCLYDNLTIGLDASNRLKVISGSSQWTTSGSNIYYNVTGGRVGIGTATPSQKLHIDSGCLYITNNVTNPGNNTSASFWNQAGIGPTISGANFSIQTSGTTERIRINGNGNVLINTTSDYSTNTKLFIQGSSSGYSQPLVRIQQNAGWDGNYALQVVGYSDFGGIRINGADIGNTICTTGNNNMGFSTNLGNMLFNVNGSERMRIDTAGNIGIGTTPSYKLDVNGNINCTEIYRSGISLTTTLGTKQNTLIATTDLLGVGTSITALNATNITSGTLSTAYGGTGVTTGLTVLNPANLSSAVTVAKGGTGAATLTSGQLLIGNGTAAVLQSANLAWDNTTNTLSATNISGSGTGLTALNATNITSGTLSTTYGGTGVTTGLTVLNPANLSSAVTVAKGGTGAATLTSGQLLIGNGTTAVLQSANLAWNNTTNTLSATNISGSGTSITALNATNITSGTLSTAYGGTGVTTGLTVLNPANLSSAVTVAKGGTGAATLTSGQLLIGNGTAAVLQSANLAWDNTTNVLNVSSNININGNVNQAQSLYFRGSDYNLGIAGAAGNYSSSAVQNDMILRTLSGTNLILQSGSGSSALKINNNNYVGLNKILQLLIVPADNRTVTETTIINNGGIVGNAFGGDTYLSSYWGVAIGLNYGGFTDGIGGGNNSQSIIPGQSAFTVNLRSSSSSTLFDKTLFTVLPSGNVGIGTTPSYKLDVNGNVRVTGNVNTDPGYSMKSGAFFITDKWNIYVGTSPTNVINSLIFFHSDTGINSKWWFNGTQTNTQSEISDYRVKKEIKEIDNPLDKLMLLKPKEYKLCQDKDYNKKFGLIAQDIYETDLNEFVVNNEEEYVANILANGTYNNKLITSDKKLDHMNIDDEIKLVFSNDGENKEYIIDGNDGPFENRYKRRYVKVKSIIDDYTFEISDELDIKEESFLIYGKKVNDFHKLDYHSMYALNIAATQELFKIVQDLKTRI